MSPIIYVAIGIMAISLAAFLWNIFTLLRYAIFEKPEERRYRYSKPLKSRRSMINKTSEKSKTSDKKELQEVEEEYTLF